MADRSFRKTPENVRLIATISRHLSLRRLLVVRPLPLAVRAATQGNNHHEPSTSDAPTDSVDEAWLSEFEGLLTKIKSDRSVRQERESDTDPREKVFLVAATTKDAKFNQTSGYSFKESLEELGRLADTAGLRVMGSTYQVRGHYFFFAFFVVINQNRNVLLNPGCGDLCFACLSSEYDILTVSFVENMYQDLKGPRTTF